MAFLASSALCSDNHQETCQLSSEGFLLREDWFREGPAHNEYRAKGYRGRARGKGLGGRVCGYLLCVTPESE